MQATGGGGVAGRVAAAVVAAVCFAAAVQAVRTAEKAYRLYADIAADVARTGGAVPADDETVRTAPVWAGLGLLFAAAGGAVLCYALLPRVASGAGEPVAPNQALQQTPAA